jgi:hypothetical protein
MSSEREALIPRKALTASSPNGIPASLTTARSWNGEDSHQDDQLRRHFQQRLIGQSRAHGIYKRDCTMVLIRLHPECTAACTLCEGGARSAYRARKVGFRWNFLTDSIIRAPADWAAQVLPRHGAEDPIRDEFNKKIAWWIFIYYVSTIEMWMLCITIARGTLVSCTRPLPPQPWMYCITSWIHTELGRESFSGLVHETSLQLRWIRGRQRDKAASCSLLDSVSSEFGWGIGLGTLCRHNFEHNSSPTRLEHNWA